MCEPYGRLGVQSGMLAAGGPDMSANLKQEIKRLMVANLMLQVSAEEIGDDQLFFGPGSLGLDSVDALQLVVALDKTFGLKIPDPETARQILQSVNSIAAAVAKHLDTPAGPVAASPASTAQS